MGEEDPQEEKFHVNLDGKDSTWHTRVPCGSNQSMVTISPLFFLS